MSAALPLVSPVAATTSIDKRKIRFLLLEGIDPSATATLQAAGYSQIESLAGAPSEVVLRQKLADVHFVGIRSRTQLTAEVLAHAPKLIAIGCFCIGTNQVDLVAARQRGIAVFNAPFSNTRSVAELVLGEAILLLRGVPGVLSAVNQVFADNGVNIAAQYLQTRDDLGYVVIDVDAVHADAALSGLAGVTGTLRTRVLF